MIYFIQAASGTIKIGFTTNWLERLKSLRQGTHETLTPLVVIEGDKAREKAILERFATSRIRGEWFEPSPLLLEFIETHRGEALTFDYEPKRAGRPEPKPPSTEDRVVAAKRKATREASAISLLRNTFSERGLPGLAAALGTSQPYAKHLVTSFVAPTSPSRTLRDATIDRIMRLLGGERLPRHKATGAHVARVRRFEAVDMVTLVKLLNGQFGADTRTNFQPDAA